jgi:hypothetical protein
LNSDLDSPAFTDLENIIESLWRWRVRPQQPNVRGHFFRGFLRFLHFWIRLLMLIPKLWLLFGKCFFLAAYRSFFRGYFCSIFTLFLLFGHLIKRNFQIFFVQCVEKFVAHLLVIKKLWISFI